MSQFTPTKTAAVVFAPTAAGNPRGADMAEAQTLAMEQEAELQRLSGAVVNAITFAADAFTIPDGYKPGSVYDVSALAADSTVTLPLAANNIGNVLVLKRTVASNTYKVTVQRASADTIDGWATGFPLLAQGDMVALFPKSGQWVAIAVRLAPYIELVTTTEAARTLLLGTVAIDFEIFGAAGQGGGIAGSGTANATGAGGGGGGGAESRGRLDTRSLATLALTVGAAGTLAAAGNNTGTDGGDSEITWNSAASKVTSAGGKGGKGGAAATTATINLGGVGGAASTTGSMALVSGLVQRNGEQGGPGIMPGVAAQTSTGKGGSTSAGAGAPSTTTTGNGAAGQGLGGAGEGAKAVTASATSYQGGAGTSGGIRLIHHFLR